MFYGNEALKTNVKQSPLELNKTINNIRIFLSSVPQVRERVWAHRYCFLFNLCSTGQGSHKINTSVQFCCRWVQCVDTICWKCKHTLELCWLMSSSKRQRVNMLIYQSTSSTCCNSLFAEAQQIWNTEPCLCLQQFNHVVNESYRTIDEVKRNLDGRGRGRRGPWFVSS